MNGIISESNKRNFLSAPKLASTVVLGVCLFSGFVFGMSVKPESVSRFHFFKTQKISFEKIAWISADKINKIQIEKMNSAPAVAELSFVPFELKKQKVSNKTKSYSSISRSSGSNLAKLGEIIKRLNEKKSDVFADFRRASSHFQKEFILAVEVEPTQQMSVALVHSSAETVIPPASIGSVPPQPKTISQVNEEKTVSNQEVNTQDQLVKRRITSETAGALLVETPAKMIEPQAVVTSDLSKADQKKFTETLLNAQLASKNEIRPQAAQSSPLINLNQGQTLVAQNDIASSAKNLTSRELKAEQSEKDTAPSAAPTTTQECDLSTHAFIKPNAQLDGAENSQISPEHNSWVSKSWGCKGWIRSETTNYIPTVTLHPAPNEGPTLLLDQNSLALLAIRSGVRIAKGMGTVLGVLPENYKVEFIGRSEDTEYFESNGKKYFAILNVEPGAGVLELQSQKNQNLSSTVFTPVFEDSVTYLDLVEPTPQNLNIKVVKSSLPNDPDVAGLTVGISTQNGIQAITQSSGQTTLRNVNLIHGFPVFVDISSKQNSVQGYTYRYELKERGPTGFYVVNQVTEKTIHHWLQQLKQGLSDQSAMVIGLYDRKHLGGFKENYFSKVEPLNAKFGLEPMNFTILWNGVISQTDPLEGDIPRFMAVQVPEGLSQVQLMNESKQIVQSSLMPISPRVIHVVSE